LHHYFLSEVYPGKEKYSRLGQELRLKVKFCSSLISLIPDFCKSVSGVDKHVCYH